MKEVSLLIMRICDVSGTKLSSFMVGDDN